MFALLQQGNEALMRRARWVLFVAAAAAVVGADAITKAAAEGALLRGSAVALTPFLSLRLGFNPGVSYGLFPATSPLGIAVLLTLQLSIIAGMVVWAARSRRALEHAALALIVGGAVGNLLDRAGDGVVTDFLDLHVQGWHWPAFNLADTAITFGAALLLWAAIRPPRAAQVPTD